LAGSAAGAAETKEQFRIFLIDGLAFFYRQATLKVG
jgi:hypothetical protein